MNSKSTWVWLLVAAALFAVIVGLKFFGPKPTAVVTQVLPGFRPAAVTSVLVRPADQLEIRADRTTDGWELTKPIVYPAQANSVAALLNALEHLAPAAVISGAQVRKSPNADQEFGFVNPQATLALLAAEGRRQIIVGTNTAPGDQVYVQVVGGEGVFVVDAEWLKLIPRAADQWRDTALLDLRKLAFNRITVSNAATLLELQFNATNHLWKLARPMPARADNPRLTEMLQKLLTLRVTKFITDNPKTDAETFGLQPPELEIAFSRGTNAPMRVQFGKSPTNDPALVYARRDDSPTIVTVAKENLTPWRAPLNEFRDQRLVALTQPVDLIEVVNGESFTLQRQASNTWRLVGQELPVDSGLVAEFLHTLTTLPIVQFKDAITEPDLPAYGLAEPARQIILRSAAVTNGAGPTNLIVAELAFGETKEDPVFVRRADENPVYGIRLADYEKLPAAAWQLQERRIWNFTTNDVARLTIRQNGKVRELLRQGTNSWAFAPGSQGMINDLAVEEAVFRYGEMAAASWAARGAENLPAYGFKTNNLALTFELKNGTKYNVEFGGVSPAPYPYAATTVDGETWIFEFPLGLYQLTMSYLAIPANVP